MLTSVEAGTCSPKTAVCDVMTEPVFMHYWPKIEQLLDAEPELWNYDLTKEQLYEGILAGRFQAWAVQDSEWLKVVFLTRLYESDNGTMTLQLWWMWGVELAKFLPLLEGVLNKRANELNCSRIEITGRKGWGRFLAPLGVQHLYSVYGRPVRIERSN